MKFASNCMITTSLLFALLSGSQNPPDCEWMSRYCLQKCMIEPTGCYEKCMVQAGC